MAIYLGLGSNLGDRRQHLRDALALLNDGTTAVVRVSPVVESPAMLPPAAPPDWNSPFLNLVAECRSALPPDGLLARLKDIERSLGRDATRRWAPRPIDIDILLYDDRVIDSADLTVPHPGLADRAFFLTPLAGLGPGIRLPGARFEDTPTALEALRRNARPIPLWMGIVNLTPDSFSDGGEIAGWTELEPRLDRMLESGVHMLDLGAESTRPGAFPLTADDEWSRLAPNLERCIAKLAPDPLRPAVSIDTYHVTVARRALALGADIVNDVSGLTQDAMIELAATSGATFVAMHNLGLPASPDTTLPADRNAADRVEAWLDAQLERWHGAGIGPERLIFDPGVGFGKNPLQSLELLRDIGRFRRKGLRVLVGHSRKSFMRRIGGGTIRERDLITIGSSLALADDGVDILRVHNVPDHVDAWRGFSHLRGG